MVNYRLAIDVMQGLFLSNFQYSNYDYLEKAAKELFQNLKLYFHGQFTCLEINY